MSKNHAIQHITIAFILLFSLAATACSGAAPTPRAYRIGIINPSSGFDDVVKGFKDGLAKLGYVEGKNTTYLYGGPISDATAQTANATALESQKVDLIFTNGTAATLSAQKGTQTTPIVFAPVAFPVEAGIASSLSSPGGHTTGVQNGGSEGKRLEYLLSVVPKIKRVYIPINPNETVSEQSVKYVQQAADRLGISLVLHEIRNDSELKQALAEFPDNVDAMFFVVGPWLEDSLPQWVDLSLKKHLPFATESAFDDGGLVTYIPDDYKTGFQAAGLADHILRGSAAGDLPIESAEFSLGVNLKTAQAIGVDVPDSILRQAANVVR